MLQYELQICEVTLLLVSISSSLNLSSEFCGGPVCKTCIIKQRPLPGNHEQQNEKLALLRTFSDSSHSGEITSPSSVVLSSGPRFQACKVCDRKFYVRELIKASRATIED